jgi:hypothetical protein
MEHIVVFDLVQTVINWLMPERQGMHCFRRPAQTDAWETRLGPNLPDLGGQTASVLVTGLKKGRWN